MNDSADYRVALILRQPDAPPTWESRRWAALAQIADDFRGPANDGPELKVRELDVARRHPRQLNGLTWDPESFARWTHAGADSENRIFEGLAAWFSLAPSARGVPRAYLELAAPFQPRHFGEAVLVAVRCDAGLDAEFDNVVEHLDDEYTLLIAYTVRQFWYALGGAFVRSIDHLVSEEILSLDRADSAPTIDAINAGSDLMSRRTRIDVPRWR